MKYPSITDLNPLIFNFDSWDKKTPAEKDEIERDSTYCEWSGGDGEKISLEKLEDVLSLSSINNAPNNTPNSSENDVFFASQVHESLNDINRRMVNERGFWAYLTFFKCWDYTRWRWAQGKVDRLHGDKSKSWKRNPIGRLWWIAELTYQADNDDPYSLTKQCNSSDFLLWLLDVNIGMHPAVVKKIIQKTMSSEKNEFQSKGYQLLMSRLYTVSSNYLTSQMTDEKLDQLVGRHIEDIREELVKLTE